MSKESSPESNRVQRRASPPFTHDQPVIIDGTGSVALEFDATDTHAHYFQISESVYTGVGLSIESVSVRLDPRGEPGSGKECELPGRFCTVAIEAKHPEAQDSGIIKVRGVPGGIVISVDPGRYPKGTQIGNRKRHHNPAFRIESLKILDAISDEVINDCSHLLPDDRKCFIDIIDDHLLRDTQALAERFDARAE